jgi:hypothetical protein
MVSYLLVLPEFDCFYFCAERELSYAFELVVVPKHDFVARPLRTFASTNEGKNVAPVEHFTDADSAIYVTHELATERQRVEDAKASFSAHGKAVVILVKANVQYILIALCRTLNHSV